MSWSEGRPSFHVGGGVRVGVCFSSCVWCEDWTVHFPLGHWRVDKLKTQASNDRQVLTAGAYHRALPYTNSLKKGWEGVNIFSGLDGSHGNF